MTVLVMGAARNFGSALFSKLLDIGAHVTILDGGRQVLQSHERR